MPNRKLHGTTPSLDVLKRIAIYGLLTLVLSAVQCAFFPMLSICSSTPDLILAMLIAIALLDSSAAAAVCAVASGFFIDAIGGGAIALTPLIYVLIVLFISLFSGKVLKSLPAYILLMLPTLLCRAAATYFYIFAAQRSLLGAWVLTDILLPELIWTALCSIPIYFLLKLCSMPLHKHGRFSF